MFSSWYISHNINIIVLFSEIAQGETTLKNHFWLSKHFFLHKNAFVYRFFFNIIEWSQKWLHKSQELRKRFLNPFFLTFDQHFRSIFLEQKRLKSTLQLKTRITIVSSQCSTNMIAQTHFNKLDFPCIFWWKINQNVMQIMQHEMTLPIWI